MNNPYQLISVNDSDVFMLTPHLSYDRSFGVYGKRGKVLNIHGKNCEQSMYTAMTLRDYVCLLDPRTIEYQFRDNIVVVAREFV
jgi:hypothetical protein